MPHLNTKKRFDLLVFVLLIVVSAIFSLYFRTDIIFSILLYLGLPSAYLWLREPKNTKKVFAGSILLGILLGMAYSFLAESAYAWKVNYGFFPFNHVVLGSTPFGDFIWAFLILFATITFYEHFLDHERQPKLSKYATLGLGVGLSTFALVLWFLSTEPDGLQEVPYGYLILGVLTATPLALLFFTKKQLLYKVMFLGIFFFILNLVFELTALQLGQWSFPGNYIASVSILGAYFPIEELLFWIVLASPSLIVCYEFLIDDRE